MLTTSEKINEASLYITNLLKEFNPTVGIVLGSALGNLADEITSPIKIKFDSIPHFRKSTVEGHSGQLVIGLLKGKKVIAMQGRLHYYEGYSLEEVTFPIRVMKKLGVEKLIVTNAAGGVNRKFTPGDLMLITDHLNFSGTNPLIGKNLDEFGPRFPDMSDCYDKNLIQLVKRVGVANKIELQEGVYNFLSGPSYETPAEIRALEVLGASAVGMSTVPEVIVAVHSGIKVIGISCITNMAAGISDQKLSHAEVIETSKKANEKFILLLKNIVEQL